MKYTTLSAILIIFIGLLSSISQASSPTNSLVSSPTIQLAQNNNQSLNNAVRSVKQRTGGRILSAKTVGKNGRRVHKIKVLLPSGKVQTFTINAQ